MLQFNLEQQKGKIMTRINLVHPSELHVVSYTTQKFPTKDELLEILISTNFAVLTTAKILKLPRSRIYSLIKQYNLIMPVPTLGIQKLYKIDSDKVNNIYYKMKNRCYNKKSKDYQYYGFRGITVCDEWLYSRDNFAEYVIKLENFGIAGYSMDRIDNNSNYKPGNIRFVTHKEQCRNRRSNIIVRYNNEDVLLIELCEKLNLNFGRVDGRIKAGWDIHSAISAKHYSRKPQYDTN